MMRLACFTLAAVLLLAGLSWWRPAAPVGEPGAERISEPASPEALDGAAAALRSEPAATPAALPPPPAPADAPVAATLTEEASSIAPAEAGPVATPRLAETHAELLAPREAFAEEAAADAFREGPPAAEPGTARSAAPDVQRSADLVRRLLAVQAAIRE